MVDFEKKLGLPVRYHRLNYIVLVNVLYQLRIDCNVRIADLEREYAFLQQIPQRGGSSAAS